MNLTRDGSTCSGRPWHGPATVEQNVPIARDIHRLTLACPEIAARAVPGQFVMIRLAGSNDPLLGRPMAVYDLRRDADGTPRGIDVVYMAVGRMTGRLARVPSSAELTIWGPLGNGFPPTPGEHLIMVAGGIGVTPFLMLAQEYLGRQSFGSPPRQVPRALRVTLCYGAASGDFLACVDDFLALGIDVRLATDDGSQGHHGLVTELIGPAVEETAGQARVVCCGPEPMMAAVVETARRLDLPCQVSLETPMACGMGICFSCVARVRDASGQWDYKRTCVEGPVFEGRDVEL